MAVESALRYIQALRLALTKKDTEELNRLLFATEAASKSTWDLVYAQLQLLGLNDEQYKAALTRINTLRSLTDTAITSIGKQTGMVAKAAEESNRTLTETLKKQESALRDLLKYVEDMIRSEVKQQIDALNEQVKRYKEIVSLQKESLKLAKDKDAYERSIEKKVKSLSELQARINLLSLDDSREAQAQKKKLEEELAELSNQLADEQANHAYDAQVDSLDKMQEAYEKEKDREIKVLEDSILCLST